LDSVGGVIKKGCLCPSFTALYTLGRSWYNTQRFGGKANID
jgi:hypothetical protein